MTDLSVSELLDELKAYVEEEPRTREEMVCHLSKFTKDDDLSFMLVLKASRDGTIAIKNNTNGLKWTTTAVLRMEEAEGLE